MNPLFRIDFSISDSLKIVRKSVLIYETIIKWPGTEPGNKKSSKSFSDLLLSLAAGGRLVFSFESSVQAGPINRNLST